MLHRTHTLALVRFVLVASCRAKRGRCALPATVSSSMSLSKWPLLQGVTRGLSAYNSKLETGWQRCPAHWMHTVVGWVGHSSYTC